MIVKNCLKWGLLLGIAVAIITQILTWLGLGLTNWFVFMSIILTVLTVAWVSNKIQLSQNGKLSFMNAIVIVVILVLTARFILQCYMFIYTRYIDPSWVDTVAQSWAETLQASGTVSEQINSQIQGFRKSYEVLPMFTTTLVLYGIPQFFWGFLTSLFFVFNLKNKFLNKSKKRLSQNNSFH